MIFRNFRIFGALALAFVFCTGSCMSGFYSRENQFLDNFFAIYTIDASDYPDDDVMRTYLGTQQAFPELNTGDLVQILGGLKFKKESLWGDSVRPVFYPAEVERFAGQLVRTMKAAGPDKRILLISRFDPDESVLSRMERTSVVIWNDSNGLNLLFGDIKDPVPYDDFLTDDNWTEVLPISFRKAYPDLSLIGSSAFEFKKVGEYDHETWAVIGSESMQSLMDGKAPTYEEDDSYFTETTEEPRGQGPAESEATLKEKLRQLGEARKAGLITEEEYKSKREEILQSF